MPLSSTLKPRDEWASQLMAIMHPASFLVIDVQVADLQLPQACGEIAEGHQRIRVGQHLVRATQRRDAHADAGAANGLGDDEILRLHAAIRQALTDGIDREGASVNWYRKPDGTTGKAQEKFAVYDRAGQPCLRCGTPVEKTRVAQRGTHYCPVCQPPA